MGKEWYVVNTYSGHENKVKEKLEMRASTMEMGDYIHRIIVPVTKEIVTKDGVTKEKENKMFPGYILVEMVMSDEAWFIVRNTPGVTGFIGSSGKGAKPFPLTKMEIDKILKDIGMPSTLESELKLDSAVKVLDGPFAGMLGKVKVVDTENEKVEVALDLFGQETVVELKFTEIENV